MHYFDRIGETDYYVERYLKRFVLIHDSDRREFRLIDRRGEATLFFDVSIRGGRAGRLKALVNAARVEFVATYNANDQPEAGQQTGLFYRRYLHSAQLRRECPRPHLLAAGPPRLYPSVGIRGGQHRAQSGSDTQAGPRPSGEFQGRPAGRRYQDLNEKSFIGRTVDQKTIYVLRSETNFQEENSGAPATTDDYSYQCYADTFQPSKRITTLPAIPTEQNGSGSRSTRSTRSELFDVYGRTIWLKDERGYLAAFIWDRAGGDASGLAR